MKSILIFTLIFFQLFTTTELFSQDKRSNKLEKPYRPEENAETKIEALLIKAKAENKNIILQAGGNWCVWCLRFNDFIKNDKTVKNAISKYFLYYHLNYSTDNKNEKIFEKYAPDGKKLGYPFFIILDSNGNVLGLQESGSLESGKSYDTQKVVSF